MKTDFAIRECARPVEAFGNVLYLLIVEIKWQMIFLKL